MNKVYREMETINACFCICSRRLDNNPQGKEHIEADIEKFLSNVEKRFGAVLSQPCDPLDPDGSVLEELQKHVHGFQGLLAKIKMGSVPLGE